MSRSDRQAEGYRIFVGGIDPRVGKTELEREFERFGSVIDLWVARNPPGFAFVVYKYLDEAEKAIKRMDRSSPFGSRLRVEHAANSLKYKLDPRRDRHRSRSRSPRRRTPPPIQRRSPVRRRASPRDFRKRDRSNSRSDRRIRRSPTSPRYPRNSNSRRYSRSLSRDRPPVHDTASQRSRDRVRSARRSRDRSRSTAAVHNKSKSRDRSISNHSRGRLTSPYSKRPREISKDRRTPSHRSGISHRSTSSHLKGSVSPHRKHSPSSTHKRSVSPRRKISISSNNKHSTSSNRKRSRSDSRSPKRSFSHASSKGSTKDDTSLGETRRHGSGHSDCKSGVEHSPHSPRSISPMNRSPSSSPISPDDNILNEERDEKMSEALD